MGRSGANGVLHLFPQPGLCLGEAEARGNHDLLSRTAAELLYYAGRMLLAHNVMLYPWHKWFMDDLRAAREMPEGFRVRAQALYPGGGCAIPQKDERGSSHLPIHRGAPRAILKPDRCVRSTQYRAGPTAWQRGRPPIGRGGRATRWGCNDNWRENWQWGTALGRD